MWNYFSIEPIILALLSKRLGETKMILLPERETLIRIWLYQHKLALFRPWILKGKFSVITAAPQKINYVPQPWIPVITLASDHGISKLRNVSKEYMTQNTTLPLICDVSFNKPLNFFPISFLICKIRIENKLSELGQH